MQIYTIWVFTILFLFGLAVGSFINAFEYRLRNKIDFVFKRSHCPKCKHELGVLDLIPILSFVLIRGKCRYCGTKVSWQYPLVEFVSGMLFLASGCYVMNAMHIEGLSDVLSMLLIALLIAFFFAFFLFIALYDVKHQIIPNSVIYPAIVIAIIFNIIIAVGVQWSPISAFLDVWGDFNIAWNVLSAISGASFIILLIVLTRGKGMGGGDVKLLFFMGLALGPKRLLTAFYIAVVTGSILGILWALVTKHRLKGMKVPFGLFLSIGAMLSVILYEYVSSNFFLMYYL
jgi:leader peptidase (prepilin peptidase)/N-methyltransferase